MPRKNSRRVFVEDGYYHLYNRGVETRAIFLDVQDYGVFLSYLKESLSPKDEKGLSQKLSAPGASKAERNQIARELRLKNFSDQISLLAFCLMPNHFHLLIQQRRPRSMDQFMKSLGTRYAMYFNNRYTRVGPLYQGVYRAVLVRDDAQFLHLSRYIHSQALSLNQPSSMDEYLGKRKTGWVHPESVLSFFSQEVPSLSYKAFVDSYRDETMKSPKELILES